MTSKRLRLIAEDLEDLLVISAHLESAVIRVSEMSFLPSTRRFVLLATRRDRRSALRIESVLSAKSQGFSADETDNVLTFLHLSAQESAKGVVIDLVFAEGAVRLEAEAIELLMEDLETTNETAGNEQS